MHWAHVPDALTAPDRSRITSVRRRRFSSGGTTWRSRQKRLTGSRRNEVDMGRLTDDMTRVVSEIHAARRARERSVQDRARAARERRRRVADLKSAWAADIGGARAAWSGPAPSSSIAGVLATGRPGRWDADAEHEALLREATETRGRFEAERGAPAPDKTGKARRSGGRKPRGSRETR